MDMKSLAVSWIPTPVDCCYVGCSHNYNFEKYSLISKFCRKSKKHGGSCTYVTTKLEAKPYNLFEDLNQEEHSEVSVIEISQCSIIIICAYRNPNSNINIFIKTWTQYLVN
jgi:hypothetical protein